MPNPPSHPRIALPPALAARVDALRALAPTGRPSRQAVVEAALAAGLEALEAAHGVGPFLRPLAPATIHGPLEEPSALRAWKADAEAFIEGLKKRAPCGALTPLHARWSRRDPIGGITLGLCDGHSMPEAVMDTRRLFSLDGEAQVLPLVWEQGRVDAGEPGTMWPPCETCQAENAAARRAGLPTAWEVFRMAIPGVDSPLRGPGRADGAKGAGRAADAPTGQRAGLAGNGEA